MKSNRYIIYQLVFFSIVISCNSPKYHDLVIADVNIIDVKTGDILSDRTLAIDNDTISEIYEGRISLSDSVKIVNGTGKYLLPGLWDMHVHYNKNYEDTSPLYIANGVIGIREMWGNSYLVNRIRQQSKEGNIEAPTIYAAGTIIDGKPPIWSSSVGVSTPEDARKEALYQIESGVDFLKVYSRLSQDAFDAIAEVASENNVPFAGHIPWSVSIYHAMESGMASAEHLIGITDATSSNLDSILQYRGPTLQNALMETFDRKKFDSLANVLANSDFWLCPTLTVNRAIGWLNDSSFRKDERLKYLPKYITSSWDPKNDFRFAHRTDEYYETNRKVYKFESELLGELSQKGAKILAGTDSPNPYSFPGFSIHDEMSLMVEAGVSRLTALQASTINAARFMKKENKFGSIEKGKIASLLLLNGNPLEDIKNTQSIEMLILKGELYSKAKLSKMLKEILKPPYSAWLKSKIQSEGLSKAMDSLNVLLQLPDSPYRLTEGDLNDLGNEFMASRRDEAALTVFKKNIELFPSSSYAYDSYAEANMKTENYDQAIAHYQKSYELNPLNSNAKNMIDSLTQRK